MLGLENRILDTPDGKARYSRWPVFYVQNGKYPKPGKYTYLKLKSLK